MKRLPAHPPSHNVHIWVLLDNKLVGAGLFECIVNGSFKLLPASVVCVVFLEMFL